MPIHIDVYPIENFEPVPTSFNVQSREITAALKQGSMTRAMDSFWG